MILRQCYLLNGFPQNTPMLNRYQDILRAGKTPLIIDAGANVGFAATVFREQFLAASIVSIEPVKKNCDLARKNVEAFGSIQILQKCLWHRESNLVVENPGAKDFEFRFEETTQPQDMGVGSVTIDNIINGHTNVELFILKMDVEGAENEIFIEPGRWWQFKPILMIEPHDWLSVGRNSLRGVLQNPVYQDSDVILKDSVIIFLPSLNSPH